MDKKKIPPHTKKAVRNFKARGGKRLDPKEAISAGRDFAAIAGEREMMLGGLRGDPLRSGKPGDQLRWHLINFLIRAERQAGMMLLLFSAGNASWSVVQEDVRSVKRRRDDLEEVAPEALALISQSEIALALEDLLDDAGLATSDFYLQTVEK